LVGNFQLTGSFFYPFFKRSVSVFERTVQLEDLLRYYIVQRFLGDVPMVNKDLPDEEDVPFRAFLGLQMQCLTQLFFCEQLLLEECIANSWNKCFRC
jgi:hypothetical protein